MNWKNRLTNYNFWISLVSAVLLIMQAFNFEFDIANLSEIATALLGLLVVIGIISNPTKSNDKESKSEKDTLPKEQENKTQKVDEISKDLKDNIDSMPSGEQNENNRGTCEDDLKVLIDKISSDIAIETGMMKENVAGIVNEIMKTYEEGEFMIDIENKEVEDIIEQTELATNQEIEEIAEELPGIDENLVQVEDKHIESEIELKTEQNQSNEILDDCTEQEEIEDGVNKVNLEEHTDITEELVEDTLSVDQSIDSEPIVEEEITLDESNEEIAQDACEQENIEENIISFKIVN